MGFYLGIDPGQLGGMGLICGRKFCSAFRFKDKTGAEIKAWLQKVKRETTGEVLLAAIENVHSSPQMGVVSAFKFGKNYGHILGILDGLEIPYRLVTPQKWQKTLGCLTKGDKNITKARAHREWPEYSATHADADALLIALWLSQQVGLETGVV